MAIDTPVAAPTTTRLGDLEGLRGLAAAGIVVFHAYQFNRGDIGGHYAYAGTPASVVLRNLDGLVSMFLVLSGYLLYRPLVARVTSGGGGGSVRVFLLRRASRILPLYWSAILIVWAARNPGLPGDWRDLVEHLTFTQVFDSKRIFYTIGPAWSLSVEMCFYLFLAMLYRLSNTAAAARLSQRSRHALAWGVPIALVVAGCAWNLWAVQVAHEPATRWAVWFNPLAKAHVFGVGMIVAVIQTRRRNRVLAPVTCGLLRAAAVALIVLGAVPRTDESSTVLSFSVLSTVAFGMLIATSVLSTPESRYRRALATPWLTWLGLISYSIYLWHEPVLLFLNAHVSLDHAPGMFPVTAGLLLTVSIPVALASYHVIEQPFARLRLVLRSDGTLRDLYGPEQRSLNPR
jgi:peptidoglycan/LPS O-acetylase OafA/YrhL